MTFPRSTGLHVTERMSYLDVRFSSVEGTSLLMTESQVRSASALLRAGGGRGSRGAAVTAAGSARPTLAEQTDTSGQGRCQFCEVT